MEDIRSDRSLAKTKNVEDGVVFRCGYHCLEPALRLRSRGQAHIGADVQLVHIGKGWIESARYEVSEKHSEANLQIICIAVSRSRIVITPPHLEQIQDDRDCAISAGGSAAAIPSSWRQSPNDEKRR